MNTTNLIIQPILNIENDGLNLVADNDYLYIRANKEMYKYDLNNMRLVKVNTIFQKDGKARTFSISNKYIFLIDFCDLYLLDKNDLNIIKKIHIGNDLTSDLVTIRSDNDFAYISMRNGKMVIFNISTMTYEIIQVGNTSSWEHQIVNEYLLIATIDGKLIKINKFTNQLVDTLELSKKNIYSLFIDNNTLYTTSQDMSINKISFDKLEIQIKKRKVIKGMSKILGKYQEYLITADGQISFFDKDTLDLIMRLPFPTGHFNKGIILYKNQLIGSDNHCVYRCNLNNN